VIFSETCSRFTGWLQGNNFSRLPGFGGHLFCGWEMLGIDLRDLDPENIPPGASANIILVVGAPLM